MKPIELQRLINQGESQTLEFKKTITHVYKIAKTIVSLANTRGGQILVGVRDDKQIIGIDPEEEKYILQEAADHYCDPMVDIQFQIEEDEDGRSVLIVNIEESPNKPHYALDSNDEWVPYIRMNDKSIMASKTVLDYIQTKEMVKYDKLEPNEKALIDFLQKKERITTKQFSKLINISERRAKRLLFEMTQRGILHLHDIEKETFYSLA